ncbi:hypothetical protein VN24_13890 [Paenibacillus beijingensis]|uniref:Uncharacterized protein n=2 Tax=Paenibacillus beijingensis TaxID=1126833 RepID=A0A0D5NRW2_9BACL|nr:hypothetical protein VN24_13890 [Paenibacillus beijingensis]
MEIHRFRYVMAGLMAVTLLFQTVPMIFKLSQEVSFRQEAALKGAPVPGTPFFPSGKLSFAWAMFNTQFWFIIPILICIAALALYVFLIWYRDWIGRSTFVYRLLMLPTERRNIYLAKLTAILVFVFGLLAFQLLLLQLETLIFNMIVPADMREASPFADAISANQALPVLLPHNLAQFLMGYGLGVIAVLIVFTAILIERSYRRIGILYAILYMVACVAAFLMPLLTLGFESPFAYLYPGEIFVIELAVCAIIAAVSIWLGFRLIAKKITV